MPADRESNLYRRLLAKDTTLWTSDPSISAQIAQRLGWLDAISFSRSSIPRLGEFHRRVAAEGFDRVILLGMGGSSLAPQVFRGCFPNREDSINLIVVDTTFPDSVDLATTLAGRGKPLFIVSSKSGATPETTALHKYFWDWGLNRYNQDTSRHFVAITDDGSPLHQLAQGRGYREIFINPSDIGGRYSALSLFGLVPACLLGVNPDTLLSRASKVFDDGLHAGMAVQLGLFIGEAVGRGRNKLTLVLSPDLAPMGPWIDQLVSESTGKDGTGVVSVLNEGERDPARYASDRMFVAVCLKTDTDWISAWNLRRAPLEQAGHPCCSLLLDDIYDLGSEFARWQVATSIASSIIGVNPFDEPDVNASKKATREILSDVGQQSTDDPVLAPGEDTVARFLHGVSAPEYVAVLAYLPDNEYWAKLLERFRVSVSRGSDAAILLAFGPRYLHSSGQLHKGGPIGGHFVVLTARASHDVPIPGERYGFQHLIEAQARGDIAVLETRGRRVLHIDLGAIEDAAGKIDEIMAHL